LKEKDSVLEFVEVEVQKIRDAQELDSKQVKMKDEQIGEL
jgi:hypothetical protein